MMDYVYISFIAASLLIGLICTTRSSHISYKLLLIFLLVTLTNEITCFILKNNNISTYPLYNIYYYFRFPFLGLIFYKLYPTDKSIPLIVKLFWGLSIILLFVFLHQYGGIKKLHVNYLITGGIFIILLALLYFYVLFKSEEVTNSFRTRFFWISAGFFFFFLGTIPFFSILRPLVKKYPAFASNQLIITKLLSILLYSLIAIDYYIQWKQKKLNS